MLFGDNMTSTRTVGEWSLPVVAILLFGLCLAFSSRSALAQTCPSPASLLISQLNVPNISFTTPPAYQSVAFAINGSYNLNHIEWGVRRLFGAGMGSFGSFAFFTNEGGSATTANQPGTLLTPPGWRSSGLTTYASNGTGTSIIDIGSPRIDEGIWWLTVNFTSNNSWIYNYDAPLVGTSYAWKGSNDGVSWFDQPPGSFPLVVIKACPTEAPSITPSSASPSRSASPSSSSASITPSSSPSLSPSSTLTFPSPSGSTSPRLYPSPPPSQPASPSPSPAILCTTNSSFSSSGNPSLNLTSDCQTTSSAGSSGVKVGLSSELSEVLLGDSSPSQIEWQLAQVNESATGVTYVYSAANITTTNSSSTSVRSFETTFLFTRVATQTNFSGLLFDVPTNFIKWSVKLDRDDDDGGEKEATPLTLRYALSQYFNLTSSTTAAASSTPKDEEDMVRKVEVSEQMTRYLLSLCASCLDGNEAITGQLDVLEFALIDGQLQRINHSVIVVTNNASGVVSFELELVFPAFSRSLIYDPSLGLLLGSGGSSSGGGGSDNDAVVIGVAVAIPIAVVVVLVVVAGLMAASWVKWRKRLSRRGDSVVHFDATEEEGVYSTL